MYMPKIPASSSSPTKPLQSSSQIPAANEILPSAGTSAPSFTNSRKHFILILAIVIGAICGTGSAVMILNQSNEQPTPSPMAIAPTQKPAVPSPTKEQSDVKVYNNQEAKFSFEYPSNWHTFETTTPENSIEFSDGTDVPRGPDVGNILMRVTWSTPEEVEEAYEEVFARQIGHIEKGQKRIITTVERLTVNGYPAMKQSAETTTGSTYEDIVYIKGPSYVSIQVLSLRFANDQYDHERYLQQYNQIFEKILASFTFNEEKTQPQVNTSTWRPYVSSPHNVTLKLPAALKAVPNGDTIIDFVNATADENSILAADIKARVLITDTNPDFTPLFNAKDNTTIQLESGPTIKLKEHSISGQKAVSYKIEPNTQQTKKQYTTGIIISGNKYYEIVASRLKKEDMETFQPTLDAIAQSITFSTASAKKQN